MKTQIGFVSLIGLALMVAGCSSGPTQTFTVTGEYVVVEEGERPEYIQMAIDEGLVEESEPIDLTNATISVAVESTDENGEQVFEELGSESFAEGKVSLELPIDKPQAIKISVNAGDDLSFEVPAEAGPGANLSVALVDEQGPMGYDQLMQVGQAPKFVNTGSKFVISGDLSSMDTGFAHGSVRVGGPHLDEDTGQVSFKNFGQVLAVDGKFQVEGVVDGPTVVSVSAQEGSDLFVSTYVIAEPNSEISISLRSNELIGTTGEGKHAKLIESWQMSEEYLAKMDAVATSYAEFQEEQEEMDAMEAMAAEQEAGQVQDMSSPASEETPVSAVETDAETMQEEDSDMQSDELMADAIDLPEPVEGCEHVDTSGFTPLDFGSMDPTPDENAPEHVKLRFELSEMRSLALQEFAEDVSNPRDAFLVLQMNPYTTSDESLAPLDKLISNTEDGSLRSAMTDMRDSILSRAESRENDESLVPGQKAPAFTLANLDGDETALYDVLNENELVLVDFWASWCGPCIASFPDLKKLYGAYSDDGFEIVTVSIDGGNGEDGYADWKEEAINQELPWIDLGDLNGFEAPTPVSYGVNWIPKSYLVDPKGCILDKDIHSEKLQATLVERFGMDPELEEEAEAETDDETVIDGDSDEVGG